MRPIQSLIAAAVTACVIGCSSRQNTADKNFDGLIDRAETLRRDGSTDADAYKRLLLDLENLHAQNQFSCAETQEREKVATLLSQYPALQCELRISEPRETLYVKTGFASPLRLVAECPANAPFALDADSNAMQLSGEGMRFVQGYLDAKLRIAAANPDASQNTLSFAARYYAQGFLDRLAAMCNLQSTGGISINPSVYQIQAKPVGEEPIKVATRADSGTIDAGFQPLAKLRFRKGSMRLSGETRKTLNNLTAANRALRITGYGDSLKAGERLANLRARAVASYLEEYAGIDKVELEWRREAHTEPGIGVVIEVK